MAQLKIADIQWLKNSPYGTFATGDIVSIYWDDSALALIAKQNGTQIFTGTQIPYTFTYNGSKSDTYKRESFFDLQVCSGTDKLIWERTSYFPYFVTITLQNHPTCAIVPVSCDLVFDNLPIVTNASSELASDGAITIQASSSYPIKYKLNSNFVYEDTQFGTSGQTSGTFTGLRAGDYIIYARDSHNCYTRTSVTIGISKSYGVRWRLQYYHRQKATNLFHHVTEILQKDYTGDVEYISGDTDSPTIFELRGGEGNLDKFRIILPTQISFKALCETPGQFRDIYTNDPEKFRLRHSINGSIVWLGKVLANQYSEQYISVPYGIDIIANDGMTILEKLPFTDSLGNQLFGRQSQIDVIALILKKINLGLNIRCACNLYAEDMADGAADDPLDQGFIDLGRYYLNDSSPNCRDVLTKILDPYGAQIVQYGGYWNIIRVEERVSNFDYRIFDPNGVYVSNGTYQSLKYLRKSGSGDLVWTDRNQVLTLNPGYGTIRLVYDLGRRTSLLRNEDFSPTKTINDWLAGIFPGQETQSFIHPDLTGWTIISNSGYSFAGLSAITDDNGDTKFRLRVSNSTNYGNYLLSDTYNLKMAPNHTIKFLMKFYVISFYLPRKVRVQITYGDYFMLPDGKWTTEDSKIVYYVDGDKNNQVHTIEVEAASPDISYINGQNINVKIFFPALNDYDFDNFNALKAKPVLLGVGVGYNILPEGTMQDVYISTDAKPLYSYKLQKTSASEDSRHNIIQPNDYQPNENLVAYQPYKWVLQETNLIGYTEYESKDVVITFEKVQLLLFVEGKQPPKESYYNQDMENENTEILNKVIYHGSIIENINEPLFVKGFDYSYSLGSFNMDISGSPMLFGYGTNLPVQVSVTPQRNFYQPVLMSSTDIVYTGYISGATGGGFVNFFRSSRAESKPLHEIYMDMYSAQYNQPWRSLAGDMYGDVLFSPLDTLVETMDNNRKYFPINLSINFKQNHYSAQFFELTSTADADVDLEENTPLGPGFTTGFSLGFDS